MFDKVMNKPRLWISFWFLICQGFTGIWTCMYMSGESLSMAEYAGIDVIITKSTRIALASYFPIVISGCCFYVRLFFWRGKTHFFSVVVGSGWFFCFRLKTFTSDSNFKTYSNIIAGRGDRRPRAENFDITKQKTVVSIIRKSRRIFVCARQATSIVL